MPRSVAASVENNFVNGLITEASGLNFPENACTDTDNCHFDLTGSVRRRLGIDYEFGATLKTVDRSGCAINTYLWKNVAGDGNISLWVVQIGETLYFYDVAQSNNICSGELATTIDLTDFQPAGASSPKAIECQFATGHGYLFVTHPTLEPFYVSFDTSTDTATGTQITLEMRDFIGVDDDFDVDERVYEDDMTAEHQYNLGNQGWYTPSKSSESSNAMTPDAGSESITVGASQGWVAGDPIYVFSRATVQGGESGVLHAMIGVVTGYSGSTLDFDVQSFKPDSGAVARTDWTLTDVPGHQEMFAQAVGFYPSNSDVWWDYKDGDEEFNPRLTVANVSRGGAPAPKGHYILEVCNQDRATVSGIAGLTTVTTSYYRPATCAFFSGRVFYAGIPYQGFSANIYFSQILEPGTIDRFGKCYQVQDPTNENLFDLLPSDGGVIAIPDAGTIIKLWSMQGGLIVFATNGIWQISGSTGLGFAANDFSVRKLSTIKGLSATSFVNVGGYPAWWTTEGIYLLQPDQLGTSAVVKTLTDDKILSYYTDIPNLSKKQARGFFDLVSKKIHWLFRSTEAGTVDEIYEYDKILIFNARTTAFNPWSISDSDVKVHAVVVVDSTGGDVTEITVVDDSAVTVVDDAAATVVAYALSDTITLPKFKYLVSYPSASTDKFTVCEEIDEDYVDFYSYDSVGVDYISYFISGYKVHGQGQRKFQSNYIYIFSQEIPSQYNFQAIWDYANTGDSGSWSSQTHQTVQLTDTAYDIKRNRLKVRGEGLALQFKIYSATGEPFDIVGWSVFETGNASI